VAEKANLLLRWQHVVVNDILFFNHKEEIMSDNNMGHEHVNAKM